MSSMHVPDGDDRSARDVILYQTPYYFKGFIDDKTFFDKYWSGGYKHFIEGVKARNKM